ncbi:MAG: glucosaminidase domain-containing protein [Rhodospirillaceae bacterium]|nr:glucosaminidase domain-containing protein [Rhodospirillaceae bacterium]
MHFTLRTSLRDRLLLLCLVAGFAGLVALVSDGVPKPRLLGLMPTGMIAKGPLPPSLPAIHRAETEDARLLHAAFDRIGFDLDSVAAGYISVPRVVLPSLPSNMEQIDGIDERKALFLRTLLPIILAVNDRIADDRARLVALRAKLDSGATLSGGEVARIMALADSYDQPDADLNALLQKVDIIPPSLALSQAIEESGWGTSRIARDRNALFGQVASSSDSGWDYRSFADLFEAVDAYARNLNTHRAYREFRTERMKMAASGTFDSWKLAGLLHRYSERGADYVQTIRSIMRNNQLQMFDGARLAARRGVVIVESRVDERTLYAGADHVLTP